MSRKIWELTNPENSDKNNYNSKWIPCPVCGKKRFYHLLPGAAGKNIAVYCKGCRQEIVFHIPADGGQSDPG